MAWLRRRGDVFFVVLFLVAYWLILVLIAYLLKSTKLVSIKTVDVFLNAFSHYRISNEQRDHYGIGLDVDEYFMMNGQKDNHRLGSWFANLPLHALYLMFEIVD